MYIIHICKYAHTNTHIFYIYVHTHTYIVDQSPKMAVCELKVQESSTCSVHKARYLSRSSVYAGVTDK